MPNEVYRAMEEGFRSSAEYTCMGMPPHISLVNSVISAESARINAYLKGEDNSVYSKDKNYKQSSSAIVNKIEHLPPGHILV